MVGTFVSTIILSLQFKTAGLFFYIFYDKDTVLIDKYN